MIDNDNQYKERLIRFRKKYRTIARIASAIDLILLFVYLVLSFVYQNVNFNSIVYYILVVITIVVMIVDLVLLIFSVCIDKLIDNLIDSLIAEQDNDSIDNDKDL